MSSHTTSGLWEIKTSAAEVREARLAALAPFRTALWRFFSDEYEEAASPTKDERIMEAFGPQARVTQKQLWMWLCALPWMEKTQGGKRPVQLKAAKEAVSKCKRGARGGKGKRKGQRMARIWPRRSQRRWSRRRNLIAQRGAVECV